MHEWIFVLSPLPLAALGFLAGRLYESQAQTKRFGKPKERKTSTESRFSETWTFDPSADDFDCCPPLPKKCPVENCRIREEHSHTEALVRRIKG
jgi:hypothetical protein